MTATPGTSVSDAADNEPDHYANLCEQARDLAESGHLGRAAQVYERVLDGGSQRHRARAALGLAVVRHDMGEIDAARRADRTAIETGHPEFGARAAYHLAVSYEHAGQVSAARDAWTQVLDFGNGRYTPAAHYGLARLAEREGDTTVAQKHWQQVLESGAEDVAGPAARDYAQQLLGRGEIDAAMAVLEQGQRIDPDPALRVLSAATHVEHAIAELSTVVEGARTDPETGRSPHPASAAAAMELLARLLAVRGDSDSAAELWEHGLTHSDPEVAADVHERLRRGFLTPEPADAEEEITQEEAPWWDPFVEAAVASDSAPMLTGELFAALTQIYVPLAAAHAGNESSPAALRKAIEEAVRAPSGYVWGRALHDDFRERLRRATGAREHILPEEWPDTD